VLQDKVTELTLLLEDKTKKEEKLTKKIEQ